MTGDVPPVMSQRLKRDLLPCPTIPGRGRGVGMGLSRKAVYATASRTREKRVCQGRAGKAGIPIRPHSCANH